MHSALDAYLRSVEGGLVHLPERDREAEIAEIRAHLAEAVQAELELGRSEDQAAAAALGRFGPPASLAKDLGREWRRRHRPSDRRAFLGAFGCTAAGLLVLTAIELAILHDLGPSSQALVLVLSYVGALAVGAVTGAAAPRRAYAGVMAAFIIMQAVATGNVIRIVLDARLDPTLRAMLPLAIARSLLTCAPWLTMCLAGVWIGSLIAARAHGRRSMGAS